MRLDVQRTAHRPAVAAAKPIRRMRGGTQSYLIEADDGNFYVVKFSNNPQHPRLLVNELIASVVLRHLGIATPEWAFVTISEEFLGSHPEVCFALAHGWRPVAAGVHFGSRYPGDPHRQTVYDFLPESLLTNVSNISDFLGALVFDKWIGNTDYRQAIFFRPDHPTQLDRSFRAHMIDNGSVFGGADWRFRDSTLYGLYFSRSVYRRIQEINSIQPWLDRVATVSESLLTEAARVIPDEWLIGDRQQLEQLLFQLLRRRERLPQLLHETQALMLIEPFVQAEPTRQKASRGT